MGYREERLNDWLRDAHAMEKQAEQMLSAQAARLEHYPELKARIEQHETETKTQAQRLEACMEKRGISPSAMKDMTGQGAAMMQGMGGAMMSDEVVKGSMASYAFEHTEIAMYKVLVAAAEADGDAQTAEACRTSLKEEEAMADWLSEHMPGVVQTYLARDEDPAVQGKR